MRRRPPKSTRTDTHFPYTTVFRSESGRFESAFAHAFSRQRGSAGADLIFNALADICIDVLPILEGAAQHRLTKTAKQAAGNLVDQPLALGVGEHLPDQDAGPGEVGVVGSRSEERRVGTEVGRRGKD